MKQYLIIITDGYVESQTLANITLFCLVNNEDEDKVTPTFIANKFRDIAHLYLKEEQYPNDLNTMFSWIMDTIGCFRELVESNGFSFTPYLDVPITKVIYLENIIDYITDCKSYGFKPENLSDTGESYYFTETIFIYNKEKEMLNDVQRIAKTELLMAIDNLENAGTIQELEEAFTVATDALDAMNNSRKELIEWLGENYVEE